MGLGRRRHRDEGVAHLHTRRPTPGSFAYRHARGCRSRQKMSENGRKKLDWNPKKKQKVDGMELRERKEWKEENHKDRVKVEKKIHLPGVCVCVCVSVCVCVFTLLGRTARHTAIGVATDDAVA